MHKELEILRKAPNFILADMFAANRKSNPKWNWPLMKRLAHYWNIYEGEITGLPREDRPTLEKRKKDSVELAININPGRHIYEYRRQQCYFYPLVILDQFLETGVWSTREELIMPRVGAVIGFPTYGDMDKARKILDTDNKLAKGLRYIVSQHPEAADELGIPHQTPQDEPNFLKEFTRSHSQRLATTNPILQYLTLAKNDCGLINTVSRAAKKEVIDKSYSDML